MLSWKNIFLLFIAMANLLSACAGWEVKTPGDQPATSQEEPAPQGKTSIGGELGKQGRGADRQ